MNIKRTVIIMLIMMMSMLFVVGFTTPEREEGDYYPRAFVVAELDSQRDMVIVTDAIGFEWEFEGIEDWEVGDMVVAIMNDNRTSELFDDYFVEIRYAGYIDPLEY